MALESLHGMRRCTSNELEDDMTCNFQPGNLINQHKLLLPTLPNEAASIGDYLIDEYGRKIKLRFNKGTTTMAFKYNNGIIVAADSRASKGNEMASGSVQKILVINSEILGTMAGGAADCQYWERVLTKQCRLYELRNREKISIAAASKLLANMVYQYKGYGLCMGTMVCGYDKKGGHVYYVDDSGHRLSSNMFSVGSGSVYAYGVWSAGYKWDMTDEEAQELARKAIFRATYTDVASGGTVKIYMMKKGGWTKISDEDCKDLYYRYQDEKMATTSS